MRTASKKLVFIAVILALMSGAQYVHADSIHFARSASDSIAPFLAMGELSLLSGGPNSKQEAIQGAKAVIATGLATEILKLTVREKRPHSESTTSFPSGHTSAAFAMATVIGDYKPKYRLLAFGTAAAIGWSRVELGAHRTHDVVAGALLGYFMAKHFTSERIVPTSDGLSLNWKW